MLRKCILLPALLCTAFCSSVFAKAPDHVEFWRQAHLSLDAEGKVTAIQFPDDGKPDPVALRLESVIRSWDFEPGKINGKPMPTETTLSLDLEGRKTSDDGYAIKVLSASTGAQILKISPPDYPRSALSDDAEAEVNLIVQIDETGTPAQVDIGDVHAKGSSRSQASLIEAARVSVKGWRFKPESVGGHLVATKMRIPVRFCLDGPSSQCPKWEKERMDNGDTTSPNAPIALDSQVKLITQVAGTTL